MLTSKQSIFLQKYFELNRDATAAVIAAGYAKACAPSTATALLKNPKIVAEIKKRENLMAAASGIYAERIAAELAAMALYDVSDYYNIVVDDNGNAIDILPKLPEQIPPDKRAAVIGYTRTYRGDLVIKFADKNKSIDQLCRLMGYITRDSTGDRGGDADRGGVVLLPYADTVSAADTGTGGYIGDGAGDGAGDGSGDDDDGNGGGDI